MRLREPTTVWLSLLLCTACTTTQRTGESVDRVGTLAGLVQRVHVDSEIAKQKVRAVYASLNAVLAGDLKADAAQVYRSFLATLADSEAHGVKLADSIKSMRGAANTVFDQWEVDLLQIGSASLRERSEARLGAARARYQAFFAAARGAEAGYEDLHKAMRDLSLFLAHDLNKKAVDDVRDDARRVADLVEDLDGRFVRSMQAATRYLEDTHPVAAPQR